MIELDLQSVVIRTKALEHHIRSGGSSESGVKRLSRDAQSNRRSRIDVDVGAHRHSVIADVGDVQREMFRKRLLNSEVPRFDIGLFESQIHHLIDLIRSVRNDPVVGNHRPHP